MKAIPIIAHFKPDPPHSLLRATQRLARTLSEERPELALPEQFDGLAVHHLNDAPSLLLDDLSEIPRLERGQSVRFYQDRARLRAGDGDIIATTAETVPGHEAYCRDVLGLGAPDWLRPKPPHLPLRIAEACWEDEVIRRELIGKLRHGKIRYVHPHMGTLSVWELAHQLQCESRCPLGVIAPPPGVTRWVNDKIEFARVIMRLFGTQFVPRTESASNLAYMSRRVQELADECEVIGLKLPNSAGGEGNITQKSSRFRGQQLQTIRQILQESLRTLAWDGSSHVLIDRWETDVVYSPSAQLWVPPESESPPVVEGLFVQTIEGTQGNFAGSTLSQLPQSLHQEIVDRCWLLTYLFQMLGYVGRCSFDMILVGKNLGDCRLEFVECNGRWGGTSLPMTMMNRIFGDWYTRPFAVHVVHHLPGLDQVSFTCLLDRFQGELFDARTGKGSLIFINPGRLKNQGGITVLAISDSWEGAAKRVAQTHQQLQQMGQAFADAANNRIITH